MATLWSTVAILSVTTLLDLDNPEALGIFICNGYRCAGYPDGVQLVTGRFVRGGLSQESLLSLTLQRETSLIPANDS